MCVRVRVSKPKETLIVGFILKIFSACVFIFSMFASCCNWMCPHSSDDGSGESEGHHNSYTNSAFSSPPSPQQEHACNACGICFSTHTKKVNSAILFYRRQLLLCQRDFVYSPEDVIFNFLKTNKLHHYNCNYHCGFHNIGDVRS